jgi:electron transfer flavoprotein beta subunit
MNIFVLIKTVRYVYAQSGTDIGKNYIGPDDVIPIVNPLDEYALEFALMVKDRLPKAQVTAVSVGDGSAAGGLKKCLAMGADKAVHIYCRDIEDFDSWAVAATLSSWLQGRPVDLVLAGRQAIDGHAGLVGPYLAEMLRIPHVDGVVKLDVERENNTATIYRAVERGNREIMECRLPALFTIARNMAGPRYPTLAGRIRTEKQTIEKVPIEQLTSPDRPLSSELNLVLQESVSNPKPKRTTRAPVQQKMSATDRMRLLLKGGKKQHKDKSKLIDADSDEAISRIERVLRDHELIED